MRLRVQSRPRRIPRKYRKVCHKRCSAGRRASQHCWRRGDNRVRNRSRSPWKCTCCCEGKPRSSHRGYPSFRARRQGHPNQGNRPSNRSGKTPRVTPPVVFSSWPDSPVLTFQRLPTSHQESQGGRTIAPVQQQKRVECERGAPTGATQEWHRSPRHQFQSG